MTFAKPWIKPPKLRDMPPQESTLKPISRGVYANVGGPLVTLAKENAVYSEPYRRLVAALPCAHCLIEGYSQAAHPPPSAKGRKEDDRTTFPLCCTRPGILGCHAEFDQYRLFPAASMREQARTWGRQTRAAIRNAGQWPQGLEDMTP